MKITKYTHACVRLEHRGQVLVIDPGEWSPDAPLDDADAILVTHHHLDHVDVPRLARLDVPVYAPADADLDELPTIGVTAGQDFIAAGLRVRAVGGRHATIADGRPDLANLGYVVDEDLYHPGDSLHVPDVPVRTLAIPAQASWFKLGEAVAFARAIGPRLSFPIHDGQINGYGRDSVKRWLTQVGTGYRHLAPGDSMSTE